MLVAVVLVALVLVAVLAYWELVVAEGVHLGPRAVALLYDLTARRYDTIKQFDAAYEEWFIGEPLAQALAHLPEPGVLDVATGTGRLPLTLLRQASFQGRVVGLDSSRLMLTQAAHNTRDLADRLTLVWLEATLVPFEDGVFDAVTCMEALEFMPDTRRALSELLRVLRPGGVLFVTNRVGSWARWITGHTQSRPAFEALLKSLGLASIQTQTWQVEYDLVWAIKPGHAARLEAKPLLDILHCPQCGGRLAQADHSVVCRACGRVSPIASDGVIELMRGARR
jgi:ubiquinone/menaquinone biosynthesis C-methylase UbiE